MSLISWNCRGLGSPNAIPDLKYLVRQFNPDLLFLRETLVHRKKIEELCYVLGFDSCFSVDRTGRSGGLAFFWRTSLNCQLIDYSNNHITIEIIDYNLGPWKLTGYYGYPNGGRRRVAWEFHHDLSCRYSGMWCIFDDFNDIMDASEKRGRTTRPNWLINGFRQSVLDSGLLDVPMEGYPFTWFKSLGTPRVVEEREPNLVAPASDHYPIVLNRNPGTRPHLHKRSFRYENAWQLEPGFKYFVTDSWQQQGNVALLHKLSICAEDISAWSRDHCKNLKKDIEDSQRCLHNVRLNSFGEGQAELVEICRKMSRLLTQDDAYWRQRA
ncbi:endonuclease/exonuclease/phosphatase family protein [Medicago truncatula]|uniref:Endonuclease/exonuclease/phosphatase family protein n=1 Tax=Medicago truncatula TaxID=3880 RepID=A0A072U7W0_MEDTR|nr:endonuclease/exonuclease/phosphatase family protein [Medicago truncatula]